jgi:predicted acylesterase/phospholipase RssA
MSTHKTALGIVLSGGGARGAFAAGVLDRVTADRRFSEPLVVAGTSAGALNAALFAAGKTSTEIHAFWLELARRQPTRTNQAWFRQAASAALRLSLSRPSATLRGLLRSRSGRRQPYLGQTLADLVQVLLTDRYDLVNHFLNGVRESHLVESSGIREQLVSALGGEVVPEVRCKLAINAVDARTNSAVRFVTQRTASMQSDEYLVTDKITVDMVLASISIPILFPAVQLGDKLLWDGGVLNNTPLAPAASMGAERVVTVLSTGLSRYRAPTFSSLGDALERLSEALLENAYNVDRKLLLSRNEIGALSAGSSGKPYREIALYETIRPSTDVVFDAGSYLYFEPTRIERMYQHGQRAAVQWLRAGPRFDRIERPEPSPRQLVVEKRHQIGDRHVAD